MRNTLRKVLVAAGALPIVGLIVAAEILVLAAAQRLLGSDGRYHLALATALIFASVAVPGLVYGMHKRRSRNERR